MKLDPVLPVLGLSLPAAHLFCFHCPNSVIWQDLLLCRGHGNTAIASGSSFRPVRVTFLFSHLLQICQHDHSVDITLPHHPPEVIDSSLQWPWQNITINLLEDGIGKAC